MGIEPCLDSSMVCAGCGAENPAEFRFCGSCGALLADVVTADARKTVTVIFCDLVGSTALGERSDPEVFRSVMQRYHAELRRILERHGGTVEKFAGDAAMAVFGVPRVHEDDPLRAVRAAVEMREAVELLGLQVRIGVSTGEVVAGVGETLVIGDVANVAARLEQAAAVGEILVGEATGRLIGDGVRTVAVDPLPLKGKSESVPAFRVLELLEPIPGVRRFSQTPFVGRADELALLERTLASVLQERSPRLVTIVGAAGIGKSRLVHELLEQSAALVLVGRCLSYGEGITYWPLAEIVSEIGDVRAAIGDSPEADLAASRIRAALHAGEAVASPEEIAWGFRKLFEALAGVEPTIVVLDDIQWAESPLLDLVEYLVAFAAESPLLLLCTARPDLLDRRPEWAAPRQNGVLLTLEALRPAETKLLADELRGLPSATRDRIVAAAEGNPLFVEQLVAMQSETGGEELEIPPTLQALLAARIDLLTPEERAAVERASVEGRLFHRGTVAALLPTQAQAQLGAVLLGLVRKGIIRADRGTLPGDDAFSFEHGLIRDAAYEAIPMRARADLHRRFADWLSTALAIGALDEIAGYHLEQAYHYGAALGAPDAGVATRAAERLAAAARAARDRQDTGAVVNLLGRASELLPTGDGSRGEALVGLGAALYDAGKLAEAQRALDDAAAVATELGDARLQMRARLELGFLRVRVAPDGAADAALRDAEETIAALEDSDDYELLARAWKLAAVARHIRADLRDEALAVDRGVHYARLAHDLALEGEITTYSVPPLVYGPVPVQQGMRRVRELLERAESAPFARNMALHLAGHLQSRLGEFDAAREAFTEWRESLRELGKELAYAGTSGCIWDLYSLADDWVGAEQALREGYEILERMGERTGLATLATLLGEALYRQGRLDEVDAYLDIGAEVGARDDVANESWGRSIRAKLLASRGELHEAEALARDAVQIADRTEMIDHRATMWLDLAHVRLTTGDIRAENAVEQALALYRQKGHVVGIRRASAMLAALA